MPIDAAIDLQISLSEKDISFLQLNLSDKYKLEMLERQPPQHVMIRYSNDNHLTIESSIGGIVLQFLKGLEKTASVIAGKSGVIRLGVFYNLSETVIFPVVLSAECIREMAKLDLSLDSTGYPCKDEESPHEF